MGSFYCFGFRRTIAANFATVNIFKVGHAMVNPNNSGGNVERWLVEVEIMMKKGLAYAIDTSMVDHASSDRMDWVQKWPGQVRLQQNATVEITIHKDPY